MSSPTTTAASRSSLRRNDFLAVKDRLEKSGLKAELAEVTMKPTTEITLAGDDAAKMQKLMDALEALDDVQEVYTNAVMDGEA